MEEKEGHRTTFFPILRGGCDLLSRGWRSRISMTRVKIMQIPGRTPQRPSQSRSPRQGGLEKRARITCISYDIGLGLGSTDRGTTVVRNATGPSSSKAKAGQSQRCRWLCSLRGSKEAGAVWMLRQTMLFLRIESSTTTNGKAKNSIYPVSRI